ncbi:tetratricopeptide repeat protein [Chryseobacterium sp. BIGb0232]|uniref:tetratricopeptide repeat protein n=1 Tax=Chryseobacterium sp. BIGb0232 TaxID=2940598 RepID=UPI000F461588|nr:tetratricopeptide repeat protein [Chryseobacterium sp. BIGb0232]MCS4303560.1 tetratricopeptide (TPR) repeat protein [Chryseobacterium sp. BIGb0232]ROS10259.1 tetratricopeptide repeat protein [Chryseobacterium nakagawai]
MDKFQRYYLSFLLLIVYTNTIAQVNCSAIEGEDCKKACELYNQASGLQGFRASQEGFDRAIELCPDFSNAYMEKAVPYLKNGDFASWKILIDKAVALDPKKHLGYRGWCKFQFLRDYKGAVLDLEELKKYYPEDLGRSQNGDYNLDVVKAMSYSALGQKGKAVGIIEKLLVTRGYVKGMFDHYQLGVTYFEQGKYDKALENFEKQSKEYDFAENIYFKSKVSKIRNKDYLDLKMLALKTYDEGKTMKDGYTHHFNKVYRKQIEEL